MNRSIKLESPGERFTSYIRNEITGKVITLPVISFLIYEVNLSPGDSNFILLFIVYSFLKVFSRSSRFRKSF